jgi:hypothetical protein
MAVILTAGMKGGGLMSGGVFETGWVDPRPLIEARELFEAMLDPRWAALRPIGLRVLV